MRMALLAMEKCTHKFIHDHNELSSKAEYLKYKNYVEQRDNIRTQQTGTLAIASGPILVDSNQFFLIILLQILAITRAASDGNYKRHCQLFKKPHTISFASTMNMQIELNICNTPISFVNMKTARRSNK